MQYPENLQRRLSFIATDGKRQFLDQAHLAARSEPLVVLGEAGMGKTTLLRELGKVPGYKYVLARSLIGAHDPLRMLGSANTFAIDALDEVASNTEGVLRLQIR